MNRDSSACLSSSFGLVDDFEGGAFCCLGDAFLKQYSYFLCGFKNI